jgi:hypothetical protein
VAACGHTPRQSHPPPKVAVVLDRLRGDAQPPGQLPAAHLEAGNTRVVEQRRRLRWIDPSVHLTCCFVALG